MEWLQNFENLLNDLASMVQYSKVFALIVCVAFLFVFAGLVIVNVNIHEAREELKEIKSLIKEKGEILNE